MEPADVEYISNYRIIGFNATNGFTIPDGRGKVKWLAAKTYDPPELFKPGQLPTLKMFHADGKPMCKEDADSAGMTNAKLAKQYFLHRERPAVTGFVDLNGFQNPEWVLREVFDSSTRVPLMKSGYVTSQTSGVRFDAELSALHDAPLLVVIDMRHGSSPEFHLQPERGATVMTPAFRFEILDTIDGKLSGWQVERARSGSAKTRKYQWKESSKGEFCAAVCRITPPIMADALMLEAFDAAGRKIPSAGRIGTDWLYQINGPMSRVASIHFRYRPEFTRLLLGIDALPAVHSTNIKPSNLFDVKVPEVTFNNPPEAHRFIENTTELKFLTTATLSEGDYPMTIHNASPRVVMKRLLNQNPGYRLIIEPAKQTFSFEREVPNTPLYQKAIQWLKHSTWKP